MSDQRGGVSCRSLLGESGLRLGLGGRGIPVCADLLARTTNVLPAQRATLERPYFA